jgi:hypothetical protein
MKRVLILLSLSLAVGIGVGYSAGPADAHRSRCHQNHTCPSDHATYRWLGQIGGVRARWLCVHRLADERNRTFNRRVVYDGRTYYCKR